MARLSDISAVFYRMDEDAYEQVGASPAWASFFAANAESDGGADPIFALPAYDEYRHFFNTVLTPGMPGAVLPVESLYKQWGGTRDAHTGSINGTGFYLGASARHVASLFDQLSIDIPEEFSATPDHLVLLVELYEFLRAHAAGADVDAFARDHFDWLPDFREALLERIGREEDDGLVNTGAFFAQVVSFIEGSVGEGCARLTA